MERVTQKLKPSLKNTEKSMKKLMVDSTRRKTQLTWAWNYQTHLPSRFYFNQKL